MAHTLCVMGRLLMVVSGAVTEQGLCHLQGVGVFALILELSV